MELIINDEKTKELLTEVLVKMIKEKRELLYELMVEAMEEVALANAIKKGRRNKFVSEDRILAILEG